MKFALICPKSSGSPSQSLESLIAGIQWTSHHRFYYQQSFEHVISASDLPLDTSIIGIALKGNDEEVLERIQKVVNGEKNTDFNVLFLVTSEIVLKFKEDYSIDIGEKEIIEFVGEKWEILENGSYVMQQRMKTEVLEEEKSEFGQKILGESRVILPGIQDFEHKPNLSDLRDSQISVLSEEKGLEKDSKYIEFDDKLSPIGKKSESYNFLSSEPSESKIDKEKTDSYSLCEEGNNEFDKRQDYDKLEEKKELNLFEDKGSYPFCDLEKSDEQSESRIQRAEKFTVNPLKQQVMESIEKDNMENNDNQGKVEAPEKPEPIVEEPVVKTEFISDLSKEEGKENIIFTEQAIISPIISQIKESAIPNLVTPTITEPAIPNPAILPITEPIDPNPSIPKADLKPSSIQIEEEKKESELLNPQTLENSPLIHVQENKENTDLIEPSIINPQIHQLIEALPKPNTEEEEKENKILEQFPIESPKSSASDQFQSEGPSFIPSKASDLATKPSFPDSLSSISIEVQSSYSDSSKILNRISSEQLSQSSVPLIIPSTEITRELIIQCNLNSKENIKNSQSLKREFMIQSWTISKNLEILKKQDLVNKARMIHLREKEIGKNLSEIEENVRNMNSVAELLKGTILNGFPNKVLLDGVCLPKVEENWMKFSQDSVKLVEKQSIDRAYHEFTIHNTKSYELKHLKLIVLNNKREILDFSLKEFEESIFRVHYLYDYFQNEGCLELQIICCSMKMSKKIIIPWLEIEYGDKMTIKVSNRFLKLEKCILSLDGISISEFDVKHFETIFVEIPEFNFDWKTAQVFSSVKKLVSNVLENN